MKSRKILRNYIFTSTFPLKMLLWLLIGQITDEWCSLYIVIWMTKCLVDSIIEYNVGSLVNMTWGGKDVTCLWQDDYENIFENLCEISLPYPGSYLTMGTWIFSVTFVYYQRSLSLTWCSKTRFVFVPFVLTKVKPRLMVSLQPFVIAILMGFLVSDLADVLLFIVHGLLPRMVGLRISNSWVTRILF